MSTTRRRSSGCLRNSSSEWRARISDWSGSGLSYLRIAPGFRMPFGHRHAEQEEVYVLVDGGARLKLDDEVLELRSWDAVRIAKDTVRALEGGPEGAVLILFGAPRTDADDAELVQGWWAE